MRARTSSGGRELSRGRHPANTARRCLTILTASLLLVAKLNFAAQAQPAPGPVGSPEGTWREQIHWIPMVDPAGSQHLLQARICRPPGDTPSRFVVIAHGTFPNNRGTVPGRCEAEATRWFLDRGFLVVLALRRGYGEYGGVWVEGLYHRPGDDYARSGLETARDIAATVDYAAALPFARSQAGVVIGESGGGWGTIAYNSIPHPRVTALISISPRRFTMRLRETEARQSLSRSVHTATTDIVSSSERLARKSGVRWSPAILPDNLPSSE